MSTRRAQKELLTPGRDPMIALLVVGLVVAMVLSVGPMSHELRRLNNRAHRDLEVLLRTKTGAAAAAFNAVDLIEDELAMDLPIVFERSSLVEWFAALRLQPRRVYIGRPGLIDKLLARGERPVRLRVVGEGRAVRLQLVAQPDSEFLSQADFETGMPPQWKYKVNSP